MKEDKGDKSSITIHFGKNPVNGGIPPRDIIKGINKISKRLDLLL